jgi:rod shape-determining protein MreD
MNPYLRIIIRFIVLVLFQVLVLNNIRFGGYINPYFYVLFILLLPYETPGWLLLILAFITGYTIDTFTNTPGMHAAATVFMAFLRPSILRLLGITTEADPGTHPGIADLGFRIFTIYALLLVFIHHLALFLLEVFRFSEILLTLTRTGLSTLFTLLLIILTQYLFYPKQ